MYAYAFPITLLVIAKYSISHNILQPGLKEHKIRLFHAIYCTQAPEITTAFVITPCSPISNADDVHVYVLGFMNISMDKPAMKGFQQIMISSWEDAMARLVQET